LWDLPKNRPGKLVQSASRQICLQWISFVSIVDDLSIEASSTVLEAPVMRRRRLSASPVLAQSLSRRRLLVLGSAALGLAIVACTPAAPPSPTAAPVKPTAPAPPPTAAPSPASPASASPAAVAAFPAAAPSPAAAASPS